MSQAKYSILKREAVLATFGAKLGTKLLNWLDPCCPQFCEAVNNCLGSGNVLLVNPLDNKGEFHFTPNARKTSITYTIPLPTDVGLFINNVTNCRLGDVIIIYIKTATGNEVINIDSNFYYTQCVGTRSEIDPRDRAVVTFTFDGELFVNTDDNC